MERGTHLRVQAYVRHARIVQQVVAGMLLSQRTDGGLMVDSIQKVSPPCIN